MEGDLVYAGALLLSGLASGFAGGLFGIGGGLLRVPLFLYLFPAFGVAPEVTMHLAAGTSLAVAVPGTISDLEEERRKRDTKGLKRLRRKKGGADAGSGGSYRQPPSQPKGKDKKPKNPKGEGMGERFRRRYREGR